jgi:hypothetical protein
MVPDSPTATLAGIIAILICTSCAKSVVLPMSNVLKTEIL